MAQGGCEMIRRNQRFTAAHPEVIDAAAGLALLPEQQRRLFARFKMEKFLCLTAE
jgi:hypothetical protein